MSGGIEIGKSRKYSEFLSKHSIEFQSMVKVKYATVLDNPLTNIKMLG